MAMFQQDDRSSEELRSGTRFLLQVGNSNFAFRWCAPGKFVMGSSPDSGLRWDDEICHDVVISNGFFIGETQVTQHQWTQIMDGETIVDLARKGLEDNRKYLLNGAFQTLRESWGLAADSDPALRCCDLMNNAPVYNISWFEACSFCYKLTAIVSKTYGCTNLVFRLPTEAEWEYACRAGSGFALSNGHDVFGDVDDYVNPYLEDIAWYGGNSYKDFAGRGWSMTEIMGDQYAGKFAGPHIVGTKMPNVWGLHDMHGNVWEWCADWYGPYGDRLSVSPQGPREGCARIVRGGGCLSSPRSCRASNRGSYDPGRKSRSVGMRVVMQGKLA